MPDKKFQAWRKRRSSLLNALSSPYPSFLNASIILLSSPLNGSIRGPQYFKPKKKAKAWIPNKRFWEWRKRNVTPECLYHLLFVTPAIFKPGSTVFKSIWMPDKKFQAWRMRRSSLLNASTITLPVIPERLYHPVVCHSWMSLSGIQIIGGDIPIVPNRKTKRKSKNMDSRLKISGMTKKECHPWMSLSPSVRHPGNLQAGVHSI